MQAARKVIEGEVPEALGEEQRHELVEEFLAATANQCGHLPSLIGSQYCSTYGSIILRIQASGREVPCQRCD
jgi:hypothetical protein